MWPLDREEFVQAFGSAESLDDGWYFVISGARMLTAADGRFLPLGRQAFEALDLPREAEHFMGYFREVPCIAVHVGDELPPEGYQWADLRTVLGHVEPALFYVAGRARQIVEWHRDHRFCGRCGVPMRTDPEDRTRFCADCGLVCYPRLSPSIIVLIRRGDDMLLARNAHWPRGFYSTLAGFVEPGESVEQAVHREVLEEVGLEVTSLRYLGSQSWPFPNSLMLGYHADWAGGEIDCARTEIAEAGWFHFEALPKVPPPTSISRWLIDAFVEEKRGGRARGRAVGGFG